MVRSDTGKIICWDNGKKTLANIVETNELAHKAIDIPVLRILAGNNSANTSQIHKWDSSCISKKALILSA